MKEIKIIDGNDCFFEITNSNKEIETVKEISAIIVHHHPLNTYDNENIFCTSYNGIDGYLINKQTHEEKCIRCSECPFSKFGSAANGVDKACRQERKVFLLREKSDSVDYLTLPTTALGEYSSYIMRLLSRGENSHTVLTKITLKKAQNRIGMHYSKPVFSVKRTLEDCENEEILQLKELIIKTKIMEVTDEN